MDLVSEMHVNRFTRAKQKRSNIWPMVKVAYEREKGSNTDVETQSQSRVLKP